MELARSLARKVKHTLASLAMHTFLVCITQFENPQSLMIDDFDIIIYQRFQIWTGPERLEEVEERGRREFVGINAQTRMIRLF